MSNRKITLPKNIKSIKDLVKHINNKYKLIYQRDYYFQDKITNKYYYSNIFDGTERIETLELIFKVSGGGKIGEAIKNGIGSIFQPIIEPIVGIGRVFMLLLKLIIWVIQLVIWLLRFTVWIFSVLIPALFTDISGLIKMIIIDIINATFTLLIKIIKGIFGDGITKNKTTDPEYRCYGVKDDGTVPTTILLSTILCPPLGVFMMYGLTGWVSILVSAILSLFYYIPGLIYALMQIYSQ